MERTGRNQGKAAIDVQAVRPACFDLRCCSVRLRLRLYWGTTGRFIESTDDAYVGGNVTPISPHISGFIAEILVTDNQRVNAGQLLVHLDDRDVRAAADHAEAILKQRTAMLASLRAKYALQQSAIQQAAADLDAKVAQAKDQLARMQPGQPATIV